MDSSKPNLSSNKKSESKPDNIYFDIIVVIHKKFGKKSNQCRCEKLKTRKTKRGQNQKFTKEDNYKV